MTSDVKLHVPAREWDHANKRVNQVRMDTASVAEVCNIYDQWAPAYDNDLKMVEYRGPKMGAQAIQQYVVSKEARILDMCAGTGMVAEELAPLGYKNLDALDGSQDMLDAAKRKGLPYRNYLCAFVTNEPTPGLAADSYDAIVTSGSFLEGHLKCNVVEEFIRLVKPGGHVVIVMREEFLRAGTELIKLKDTIDEHETRGEWRKIENRTFKHYYGEKDGALFVYQVV